MRTPERYLLSLTATFTITNVVLAFYSATSLDIYVSFFIVEYLIITLFYSPLNPKTQKMLNRVSYVLFFIFVFVVVTTFLKILGVSLI